MVKRREFLLNSAGATAALCALGAAAPAAPTAESPRPVCAPKSDHPAAGRGRVTDLGFGILGFGLVEQSGDYCASAFVYCRAIKMYWDQ
jgi:hypothetical protein